MASKQRESHVIYLSYQAMLMELFRIKMYKTRIKQWGLNKRNQQHEIRAVAHQRKGRQPVVQGKRFTICRPGRQVGVRDVIHAKKCRQVVVNEIDIPQPVSASSETRSECFTAVPTLLMTPGLLGISERIFNTIRDYYRGCFESGIWVSDQKGLDCWTVKAGSDRVSIEDQSKHLTALLTQCTLACQLFAKNSYKEGGKALISATARIKTIVQAEHPLTLSLLFRLVLDVRRNNRQEVALAILRQFSALAGMLLGDQHPLRQVCGWLPWVDLACFDEVVVRCLRNASEHLANKLGPMHRSTLYSRLRYTEEVYCDKDINQAELLKRKDLLHKCERTLGAHDMRTLDIQSCLVLRYLQREDYVTARRIGQDIVVRSHQAQPPSKQSFVRTQGLFVLAITQFKLHEAQSAEANLREAIALRSSVWGTDDSIPKYWLVFLDEWLLSHGHLPAISRVKAMRKAMLEPVYTN